MARQTGIPNNYRGPVNPKQGFQKGNKLGNRFKPGQSGCPGGRPRKLITSLRAIGYTDSQSKEVFRSFLAYTAEELKEVTQNPSVTQLEGIIADALIQARKSGNYYIVLDLLARVFGTPKQTVDLNASIVMIKQEIKLPDGTILEL
jgi:hypothetical protein